jgi:hypothetical protein
MTKTQRIEAFRAEYPELFKQVDGDRIKLTDEEYEATLAEWADNQIVKETEEVAKAEQETAKEAGKAKLAALGLTDAEIEALVK